MDPGNSLEARTLELLEWPRLLQHLADRAGSDPGRASCLALRPFPDPERIGTALEEAGEMLLLLGKGTSPPLAGVRDLAPALDVAERRGLLEPAALLDVAATLEVAGAAHRYLAPLDEDAPRLAAWGRALLEPPGLREQIRRAIDPAGRVQDDASPELAQARRRVLRLSDELRRRLNEIVEDPDLEPVLQDRYFTQREGRFVVPVRAEARRQMSGIVHGRSSSGASFFIEPEQVVEANNDLRVAEEEEHEEVMRVLRSLTDRVAEEVPALRDCLGTLLHLEVVLAKARLAWDMDAAVPRLSNDDSVDLRAARHPLLVLAGTEVVPNDLVLGGAVRFLVISGPNTGGKTVSMKTVGLLSLMARSGIPIPAGPDSSLPASGTVVADIGDEQSVEKHLSSFSAHLLRILEIRRMAGPGSLVLLDEVAGGTDPKEGAALAQALLEDLAGAGATGIVTTHYHELKALAAEDERFRNAGMEFDERTFQPTYRLLPDLPGRSSALATARRLGLDEGVIERASELYGTAGSRLDELLAQVEERARRADEESERARTAREEAEGLLAEREKELKRLRDRELRFLDEERGRLADALESARREVGVIVERARRDQDLKKAEEGRRRLRELEKQAAERLADARRDSTGVQAADLEEGDEVRLLTLSRTARVLAPPEGGQVQVAVGAVRMTVALEDVELVGKGEGSKGAATRARRESDEEIPLTRQTPGNTCDLRGMRADEAVDRLDAALDRALRAGTAILVVIHGHGTGVLREAVREHLRGSPYAAEFRPGIPGEGDDGVTIVRLR